MNYRECYYLVGNCLSLGNNEKIDNELISTIVDSNFEWDKFILTSGNHLVLPSVYLKFKEFGILDQIPIEVSEHLEMIYEINLKRNKEILNQIKSIHSLLIKKGVVPIYIKGSAYLLENMYNDIGERISADIDFLVSDDDFLKAVDLLKADGYESGKPFYEDEIIICKHYPPLVKEGLPVEVEIHRVPVDIEFSERLNFSVIDKEKKSVVQESIYFVPSEKHAVILNFFHSFMARDINIVSNILLRNFNDLYKMSEKSDIKEIYSGLKGYSQKAMLYAEYMEHTLGLEPEKERKSSVHRFIKRADNPLMSKLFFRYMRVARSSIARAGAIYLYYLMNFFKNKAVRLYILRRVIDPQWYKRRISVFLKGFKINGGLLSSKG